MTKSYSSTFIHLLPFHMTTMLPGKLDKLGESIVDCRSEIDGDPETFAAAHQLFVTSYLQANDLVRKVISIFEEIAPRCPVHLHQVIVSVRSTKQLLTVIQKACGDIHDATCFKATFNNLGTATLIRSLLAGHSAELRDAIKKLTG